MIEAGKTTENKEEQALKDNLKFSFQQLLINLLGYFKTIVNIRDEVDYEGSVDAIKKDIDFKGVNVWVLGASIVIASIGLNVNSTAVIIGAMLISPLMGPIVGIGLSIGINDFQLLIRSLKNLTTAVLISVIVSTVYFLLTPFGDVQSELIARTRPTLLDVMIAVFGGIALIVAKTKRGTVASTIFGVAIATALMPPLCTAGYGLANGNWDFFLGAFYLFLINSVFIALSTWLIVKFLKFPLASFMDKKKQKKIQRYVLVISLLIIIPSGFTFWYTIQESIFKNNANAFLVENFDFEGTYISKQNLTYNNDTSLIEVFLMGDVISEKTKRELGNKLANYEMKNSKLKIYQSKDRTDELMQKATEKATEQAKLGILEELYKKNDMVLSDKNAKISFLENELMRYKGDTIPFTALKNEIRVQYPQALSMTYGKTVSTNFKNKQDTIPTFFLKWNSQLKEEELLSNRTNIEKWLRVRLNDKKVKIINY